MEITRHFPFIKKEFSPINIVYMRWRVFPGLLQRASPTGLASCKPEMRNGLFARSRLYLPLRKQTQTTRFVSLLQHGFQSREGSPRPWNRSIRRGVRSRVTVSLSELQGNAPEADHGLHSGDNNGKAYPVVVLQALKNMEKYENCVLLTRVGSFYEVHFPILFRGSMLTQSVALFRSGREIWPAA